MSSSFVPLRNAPAEAVRAYLCQQGMAPAIVEWKYFDAAFNRGRERGYVWLRGGGEVAGFIGLIPFTLGRGEATQAAAWTCDWSLADPEASPGMGIVLLKKCVAASSAPLVSFGGNRATGRLLPRLATHTIPEAGVTLRLPLRTGALLRWLERKAPWLRPVRTSALGRLPLRRPPRQGGGGAIGEPAARLVQGVAPALGAVLPSVRHRPWHPRYGLEYVQWQVGRCPAVASWTCLAPAREEGDPQAAVLLWRQRERRVWSLALWAVPGATGALEAALAEAVAHIWRQGGHSATAVASRLDVPAVELLKKNGFVQSRGRRPLFIFDERNEQAEGGHARGAAARKAVGELAGLSFLDTDLAYRV